MLSKRFVIFDYWGKRSRGKPMGGTIVDRAPNTCTVMEKIWYYLHTTGSHGLRKKSSRIAEERMRRMKRNQYC